MKRIVSIVIGLVLWLNVAAQAEPNATDQHWLSVVQRMIAKGETRIPTNSKERLAMLKDWAAKKGYAFLVGKSEDGYEFEIFPKIAMR